MNFELIAMIWAGLIVLFTIIEALTLGLTSIWFAVGALAALIAYAVGFGWPVQIIVFLAVAILMLFYTRPIAKKVLKVGQNKTNIDALIGETGFVVVQIDAKAYGQIKLKGQIWTAKAIDGEHINVDEKVEVIAIEGVKAIVKKIK